MGSVEPEDCSALMSARSSEQSSLGIIRIDSITGLSGCLLEDDSIASTRAMLSPVKEMRVNTPMANIKETSLTKSIGMDSFEEACSPDNELNSTGYGDVYDLTLLSEGDCPDESGAESAEEEEADRPGGGLDPRYLCHVSPDRDTPAGYSLANSLALDGDGLESARDTAAGGMSHFFVHAADADISGQQISARSTSIGVSSSSLHQHHDATSNGFGSGCFDEMAELQKEFDAGGFVDGGEAFNAELVQAEQSLDRNGLPLVDFSLSSGTYDPHARIRASNFDESVNISQFLKAGSYPMGVLGDASSVEAPPRFSMSMLQSWQASSRLPEDDFNSTSTTLRRSRDTFSVSQGSGYSQIHGSGGPVDPVRVGTYTVLTAAGSAPDTCLPGHGTEPPGPGGSRGKDGEQSLPGKNGEQSLPGKGVSKATSAERSRHSKATRTSSAEQRHPQVTKTSSAEQRYSQVTKTSSAEQRYSQEATKTTFAEDSRPSKEVTLTPSADRSRPSQDSQDATVTLVGRSRASQDSQDSQDVTVTAERSRPSGAQDLTTPAGERGRPRHSATLGDSLRRKIVDVLNRTDKARMQLLESGRQSVAVSQAVRGQVTVSEQMVALASQEVVEPVDSRQPASDNFAQPAGYGASGGWPDDSAVSDGFGTFESWVDGGEFQPAYSHDRSEDLKRRQMQEMEAHRQRQTDKIQAARAEQTALRKQWEMEQDLKEKVARQKKLKQKRESKAKRDGAMSSEHSVFDAKTAPEKEHPPADESPLSQAEPASGSAAAENWPDTAAAGASLPGEPCAAAGSARAVDPDVVSRVLQHLDAAPPLSVQQVVEAVMRQIAGPDTSLDESVRSRAELDVTDILQELRGEREQLSSQMVRSARGGGGRDLTRMAETVSRLHRGVPARPRGERAAPPAEPPRRRSPEQRSASIPVQRGAGRRGTDAERPASARRRPASGAPGDRSGEGGARRRPASAQPELAVRGRRVPRMGVRRAPEELTSQTDDSDRGPVPAKRGSPAKPSGGRRQPPGRTAATANIAAAAAAAASKATAVSTCPDTASSDGSGRTYSIASDRAPGSLPAVVAEPEPEPEQSAAAAPTAAASERVSAEYESPEFLVAMAARRYPSSTPSLARSVAATTAAWDHVSPIVADESGAAEPSVEPAAEPAVEPAVEPAAEPAVGPAGSLAVLVPPPARWPSESSVEVPLRLLPGTSTGSVATTAAQPSSGCDVALPGAASSAPAAAAGAVQSTSAEAAGAAPRPRRSRIPTPVRRHVSDLAAATCQSAPSLLQPTERGAAGSAMPAPPPPALPAAAGRRPAAVLSGGDRPAGPRPVVRANNAAGAATRDAAAQTSRLVTDAGARGQRGQRDKLVRSVSAQAQTGGDVTFTKTTASDETQTVQVTTAKTTSRVSAEVQTGPTATKAVPSAGAEERTVRAAATKRPSSVNTEAQTADLTFTKTGPVSSAESLAGQPAAATMVTCVSAEAQTGQWAEKAPVASDHADRANFRPVEQGDGVSAPASQRTGQQSDGASVRASDQTVRTDVRPAHQKDRTSVRASDQTERTSVRALDHSVRSSDQIGHQTDRTGVRPVDQTDRSGVRPADDADISSHQPASVRSSFQTGPLPDTTFGTHADDSVLCGPRLVEAPDHVSHVEVLCTDILTDVVFPVQNLTEHWLQLIPTVIALEVNGVRHPPEDGHRVAAVSLRTRTLLDRHQEATIRAAVTPHVAGRITVTLQLSAERIDRLSGAPPAVSRVELRLVAERPAVEILSQEPGLVDFGTLPEDCRKVVPLTLVNLSRAAVPVTLSVLSAGRAFHLPDGEPSEAAAAAPTRLTSTLAQFTLPAADASRQGISPVTLNVALLTPCIDSEKDCPPLEQLQGSLQLQLDGASPPLLEPLLSCRLLATVGRVKLRTRCREPLELRCRPAQTTSINLPMKNTGNIPLELRLSVTGLRDSVWVRPDHVTVPPRAERDVMLTFQPLDRSSGGRGLLVLSVQPDGVAFEVDIRGVIGDCRTVERPRPGSPEMKSARRHTKARKERVQSKSRSRSRSPDGLRVSARDTAVQTSLLTLAPAGDGPAVRPADTPAFRQPTEPPSSTAYPAATLRSNKQLLLWTGSRCGRPASRSVILRNSSKTDTLALRMAIRDGPQFTFRMFDEPGAAGGSTMELSLPPLADRELTLVYRPTRVEAATATLVIKPVVRPSTRSTTSKFTIPLIAYSGASDVQLSISAEQGLRLGEVQPGATVHTPLTVTNVGDRRAFVKILAYRDAECRHPLVSSQFSARPAELVLGASESRQVALVLRVPAGGQPPASLRLVSGDDLLRHAFNHLPRDRPLSSRHASPGLMSIDFSGPFEGEQEPDAAELAALRRLPAIADTFFASLRQTRLPVRVTLSSRPMDSSDVFTNLHADDTVASILNYTSFANVTRDQSRRAPVVAAVARSTPVHRPSAAEPALTQPQSQLPTGQRSVRPSAACARPPPSDVSVESGPGVSTPEQGTTCPPSPPPPPPPPPGDGPGRTAPLQLTSDQVLFPTTALGRRSAAELCFTNSSGVSLRWSLEVLVKPWIQSTPRASDLTQVGGDVFRFHPTQGEVRPGQAVSLAARFNPPAAGYFTQTFYLVTCADTGPMDCDQPVPPSCLPVRVAGQATPAAAAVEPDRFPLTVHPDTIEFPTDQRAVKLTINNKTRLDYEFELLVSGPFSVNHQRMLARARRYIHLPVYFQPPGAGLFSGRLTLRLLQPTGPASLFHVTLLGEVP